jgi:phage anti-repressor protein/phage antirepressor YoqD-like protein
MSNSIVTQEDFQEIVDQWLKAESEGESFPADFDLAWKMAGYYDKSTGKRKLTSQSSGLIVDEDYVIKKGKAILGQSTESGLCGRSSDLIYLTCDAFKHFCLLAKTQQGRSIRQYFIESEKKLKSIQSLVSKPEQVKPAFQEPSRVEILEWALDSEKKRIEAENKLAIAAQKIEVMAPLAKLGECMTTYEEDTKTIGEIAQSYGIGRKTFFATLRDIGFIQQTSTRPYQNHIDEGRCEVLLVARPHRPERLDPVCVVTMKGQAYIAKKLAELEKLNQAEVLMEKTVVLV